MTGPQPQVAFAFTARNAAGQVIAEVNRELDQVSTRGGGLARTFVGLGANAEGARKGVTSLERGFAALAAESLHMAGPVERVAKGFLLLSGGGELFLAIVAGITAGAEAADLFAKHTEEATKQLRELATEADKLGRTPLGTAVEQKLSTGNKLDEARKELARMQRGEHTLGELVTPGLGGASLSDQLTQQKNKVSELSAEYDKFDRQVNRLANTQAEDVGKLLSLDKERLALAEKTANTAEEYVKLSQVRQQNLDDEVALSKAKEGTLHDEIDALKDAVGIDANRRAQLEAQLARQRDITQQLTYQATLTGQMEMFFKEFRPDLSGAAHVSQAATDAAKAAMDRAREQARTADQTTFGIFDPDLSERGLNRLAPGTGRTEGDAIINAGTPAGPGKRFNRKGQEVTGVDDLDKSMKEADKTAKKLAGAVSSTFTDMLQAATEGSDSMVAAVKRGFLRLVDVAVDAVMRAALAARAASAVSGGVSGAAGVGAGAGGAAAAGASLNPFAAAALIGAPLVIGALGAIFGHHDKPAPPPSRTSPLPVRIEEINPALPFMQNDGPDTVLVSTIGSRSPDDLEQTQVELARRAKRDANPRFSRFSNLRG